jgi:hypothetical protein
MATNNFEPPCKNINNYVHLKSENRMNLMSVFVQRFPIYLYIFFQFSVIYDDFQMENLIS